MIETGKSEAVTAERIGPRLTPWGWALVASLVVLLAVAIAGSNELFALAGGTAVLLLYAALWVWRDSPSLEVRLMASPSRVSAGTRASVTVAVRNTGTHRSPEVAVRRPIRSSGSGGDPIPVLSVPSLAPGQQRATALWLTWAGRGVYSLGPALVDIADPFGVVHKEVPSPGQGKVVVVPQVMPLRSLPPLTGPPSLEASALPDVGFDGDEFHTLRDYEPGDDLRKVHWALTARTGTLMVREDHPTPRAELTVLLDLRNSLTSPATFETACSVAASVVMASVAEARSVRLLTSDGTVTGFGHTGEHADRILDVLARVDSHSDGRLLEDPDDPALSDYDGSLVVVSAGGITPMDSATLARLANPESVTVVAVYPGLVHRSSDRGPTPDAPSDRPRGSLPFAVIEVGHDRPFPTAWHAHFAPPTR